MSLQTNDIGELFSWMKTTYGGLWKLQADAMPIWLQAMRGFSVQDLRKAMNEVVKHHVDFPPTLPQFLALLRESTPRLPASQNQEDLARADRIYAYTKPESNTNRKGNPHGVSLPESIAVRGGGESVRYYEKRISSEVTFCLYPWLRGSFGGVS